MDKKECSKSIYDCTNLLSSKIQYYNISTKSHLPLSSILLLQHLHHLLTPLLYACLLLWHRHPLLLLPLLATTPHQLLHTFILQHALILPSYHLRSHSLCLSIFLAFFRLDLVHTRFITLKDLRLL